MLRDLPRPDDPNLLAGDDPADDAAVYLVSDDLALVQTVDFFTPIVDDPYLFGRIAATNSLSDVYAVGGRPMTALNLAAFPVKSLPLTVLSEILRGGSDVAREAGVTIVGGHTIDDEEPKYGLSVTGVVHPDRFLTPRGAHIGDVLVLTKPLGTGIISTAHKAGAAFPSDLRSAVSWMSLLNRTASEAMMAARATAATDITGFGLLGHLADLCSASSVAAEIEADAVPLLPGALRYARAGFIPGGSGNNFEWLAGRVHFTDNVDPVVRRILADAQTSGGLLVTLPAPRLATFRASVDQSVLTAEVGRIVEGEPGSIRVTTSAKG